MIDLLISKGADVNVGGHGWTPLYEAGMLEYEDLVQLLIARGAHPPSTIHWAALRGDAAKVKSLIEGGVYVDVREGKDRTPLCSAAMASKVSNTEIAAYLLAKGANVNAKDDGGETPLHLATSWGGGRKDMVELLLSKGAEVNARDNEGYTPLLEACRHPIDKEVVELLIAKGTDLHARMTSNNGWLAGATSLHLAASIGQTELVRLLLAKGMEIDARTDRGQTPLHIACVVGRKEVVDLLLAKGTAINAKDKNEKTPLALAERHGHAEIAALLRNHGDAE